MKTKYFLRGLGAGIILSSVVLLFGSPKDILSDEEIKQRAFKLGMIEKEDALEQVLNKSATATPSAIASEEPDVTPESTESSDSKTSKEQATVQGKKKSQTAEPAKQAKQTQVQKSNASNELVVVQIKPGMWSDEIAKTFYDLQLVKDAEEFDSFLCDNGYASMIRVGSYKVPKGSTYEEIAKIITK